jgi:arylsulfatase A-like enzyme
MRWILAVAAVAAAAGAMSGAEGRIQPAKRPHILYIMADDHAAHAVSAYGSVINKTPNLDRLAAGGIRFDRCYATNSICTPSRAAIMTGQYSHINGVPVFNKFDGGRPNLAKYLQAAGYHTAIVGKWHLGNDPTGFDVWNILPGQGVYHNPTFIEMGQRKQHPGYVTDLITDFTIDILKRRPKDKPFFVMCHHKAPHREWSPDEKHATMYDDVDIPEPPSFSDKYEGRSAAAAEATMTIDRHLTRRDLKVPPPPDLKGPERNRWMGGVDPEMTVPGKDGKPVTLAGEPLRKWKYQRYIKDYLRCIASVDDNVGRLLDFLDAEGLAKDTVVVYTSDQGFFLGDHNWYDKRFMYEESLKMPFLVRYPGVAKPATSSDRIILNVDFAPTFIDLAGGKVPADMQGRSFAPLLRGEPPADWRTSMYYRYYHYPGHHKVQMHYGLRTEAFKLIHFHLLGQWELYDLAKDPEEMRNVYKDPAYQEAIPKLKEELYRLKKELKDEDQFVDPLPKDDV